MLFYIVNSVALFFSFPKYKLASRCLLGGKHTPLFTPFGTKNCLELGGY